MSNETGTSPASQIVYLEKRVAELEEQLDALTQQPESGCCCGESEDAWRLCPDHGPDAWRTIQQPESEPDVWLFPDRVWSEISAVEIGHNGVGAFLRPQPSAQVPEGWKLVPERPTTEMLNAAVDVEPYKLGDISALGIRHSPQKLFDRCYSAMLTAAPSIAERRELEASVYFLDGMDFTSESAQDIAEYHGRCMSLDSEEEITVYRYHKLHSKEMKVTVDRGGHMEWEWAESPLTGEE